MPAPIVWAGALAAGAILGALKGSEQEKREREELKGMAEHARVAPYLGESPKIGTAKSHAPAGMAQGTLQAGQVMLGAEYPGANLKNDKLSLALAALSASLDKDEKKAAKPDTYESIMNEQGSSPVKNPPLMAMTGGVDQERANRVQQKNMYDPESIA